MSLDTWMKEFYPIEASRVAKQNALKHSLHKWEGLTKKNLKKHKISLEEGILFDEDDELKIDSDCCALCFRYDCKNCPLTKLRNGYSCDEHMAHEDKSPYDSMLYDNIRPMLNLLRKAVRKNGKK